jgi:hypothetical protein
MKNAVCWLKNIGLILFFMLFVAACTPSNGADPGGPWTATPTADTWLSDNPFNDFHDGGWVYSAREDVLYAIYGEDNADDDDDDGRPLYRIDYIAQTYTNPIDWIYDRHGSHPVIDDDGIYIYMPPSANTAELERWNTETSTRQTMATAPDSGEFSHGAWKNDRLWIVLDDGHLYGYAPIGDSWSGTLYDFGGYANVASSGSSSNLIYIIVDGGGLYSFDVTTYDVTALAANSHGFYIGGNGQFVWFAAGSSTGYLYASSGCPSTTPAVYDIAGNAWHDMVNPVDISVQDCNGHATYDSYRDRLYVVDQSDPGNVYYYQF